jgi:hypothetical protein
MRVGISTSHCGAGCTLGDIMAEWIVFAFALTLRGESIYASYGLDYAFAFSLGVVFQRTKSLVRRRRRRRRCSRPCRSTK